MTTSIHQFSNAAAVVEYHRDAFDVDRIHALGETAEYEKVAAEWGGKGAELAGLAGKEVTREDFSAVLEGRIGGQEIVKGWTKTPEGSFVPHHKPGFDITFSMPKSFALMATVGGDNRLLAVRDLAIANALAVLEAEGSQVRISEHGVSRAVASDNLLYATFQHLTSRANDPHPHVHCVVANAVFHDSRWRPLDNSAILRLRSAVTTAYLDALAQGARDLGYTLEPGKKGLEIAGISRGQIEAFSARTGAIDEYLAKRGVSRESASIYAKQVANLRTRPDKELLPRAQLMEHWQATAREIGLDLQMLSTMPRVVEPVRYVAPGEEKIGAVVGGYVARVNAAMVAAAGLNQRLADAVSRKDTAAFDELNGAAKVVRNQLRPASAQRIAGGLHGELRTLTARDVEKVLADAVASGRIQLRDGGYAPETEEQSRARHLTEAALAGARKQIDADLAVASVVAEMKTKLAAAATLQSNLSDALAGDELRSAKVLADDLRALARGLSQTPGQVGHAARQHTPYLTKTSIDKAIRSQIAAGQLTERDGRLTVESPDFAADRAKLIAQTRPAQHLDAVSAAVSRVIDRIEAAQDSLPLLRAEIADARKRGATTREKALTDEFRAASRLVDGLTDGQLASLVREELSPSSARSSTQRELADSREAALAAYAGTTERQQLQGFAVSSDLILKAAKEDGRLQDNLGRHSIESAAQTDARHEQDKQFRADLRETGRETASAAWKANAAAKSVVRQAAAKDRIIANRAAYIKSLPAAQQKAIQNRQSSLVRGAKFASLAIRRPGTALRIVTERTADALVRDTSKTAGTLLKVLGTVAFTATKSIINRQATAASVEARAATLRGKSEAARFSSLGYRQNGAGEIERAKLLSVNNAVARVGALAIDVTGLGRTTVGQAARNALVSSISTTRVNAVEALLGKAVLAAHKVVAGRMTAAWTATRNKTLGVLAERRDLKANANILTAYKSYIAAEHKYQAGKIGVGELRTAHESLTKVVAATKQHTEKVYGRVEKEHQKGYLSGRAVDRAFDAKKERLSSLDKMLGTFNQKHRALELKIDAQQRQAAIKDLRANRPLGGRNEAYESSITQAQTALRDTVNSLKKLEPTDLAQSKAKALGVELRQIRGIDQALEKAAPKLEKTKEIRSIAAKQPQLNVMKETKMDNGRDKFEEMFGARNRETKREQDQSAGRNTADALMKKERLADERQAEVARRETNRDSVKTKDRSQDRGFSW